MVTSIVLMMIALLSFLQVDRGTLQTSRMWVAVTYTLVVDMFPIDNGVGMKNDRVLQGVRDSYHLTDRYIQVSIETKHNAIQTSGEWQCIEIV